MLVDLDPSTLEIVMVFLGIILCSLLSVFIVFYPKVDAGNDFIFAMGVAQMVFLFTREENFVRSI